METRQLGGTDMRVGVLGFGGAEIGFEKAEPEAVARLLGEALDAGLNVVDTAECYLGSEELIGRAVAGRRRGLLPVHQVRPPRAAGRRGLAARVAAGQHRAQPPAAPDRPGGPGPAPQLLGGRAAPGRRDRRPPGGPAQGLHAVHRLQRRRPGGPVRGRVRGLRHAPDLGQHRRPGGDRPDPAAGPRAEHGRDRQAADRQRRLAVRRAAGGRLPPALLGPAASSSTTSSSGRARRRRPPWRCGSR